MDIDEILKIHKDDLLKKYKKSSPEHISPEKIERFVRNDFDFKKKNEESEYDSIIEHLAFCDSCKKEVKLIRNMMKNEEELFAIKEDILSEEDVNITLEKFKIHINHVEKREKAKEVAYKFIIENLPGLKSLFNSAWSAIKDIPKDVSLAVFKKQAIALGLTDPKQKASQILLFQILFILINVFDEIVEPANIDEIKSKLHHSAKQNKLPKNVKNELIEFVISEYD